MRKTSELDANWTHWCLPHPTGETMVIWHTIHQTRANNNSFRKSNKNYTLHPLKEEVTNSSKFSKVFFLLRINSVRLMASFYYEVTEAYISPIRVSASRSIQHATDLIPGTALPNLPTYRMSLYNDLKCKDRLRSSLSKVLRARAKALVLSPPCLHLKRMIYGRCVWIVGPLIRSQSVRKYARQVSWNKGVLQNRLEE